LLENAVLFVVFEGQPVVLQQADDLVLVLCNGI
jgi:hypothetical protein